MRAEHESFFDVCRAAGTGNETETEIGGVCLQEGCLVLIYLNFLSYNQVYFRQRRNHQITTVAGE